MIHIDDNEIRIDSYHRINTAYCPSDIADKWLKVWDIDPNLASSLFDDFYEVFTGAALEQYLKDEGYTRERMETDCRAELDGINLATLEEDARTWYANVG